MKIFISFLKCYPNEGDFHFSYKSESTKLGLDRVSLGVTLPLGHLSGLGGRLAPRPTRRLGHPTHLEAGRQEENSLSYFLSLLKFSGQHSSVSVTCSTVRITIRHAACDLPISFVVVSPTCASWRGHYSFRFVLFRGAGPSESTQQQARSCRRAVGTGESARFVRHLRAHLKASGLSGDLSQNWPAHQTGPPASL